MEKSPIQGVNQQVTNEDWAYLAGLWDGEGSIGISKYKNNKNGGLKNAITLQITNTDEAIINEVTRVMDVMGIKGHVGLRMRTKRLPAYQISIRRFESCIILLEKIIPYLKAKKELAVLVLRYIKKRMASCDMVKLNFTSNGKKTFREFCNPYDEEEQSLVEQIRNINSSRRVRNLNDYTQSQPRVA